MSKTIYLFIILASIYQLSYAQDRRSWGGWQTVFENDKVLVRISFALSTCNGEYLRGYSYYRTSTQIKTPVKSAILTFRYEYIDCEGKTGSDGITVNFDKIGIDDSRGQWFLAPQVTKIYNINYKDINEKSNSYNNLSSGNSIHLHGQQSTGSSNQSTNANSGSVGHDVVIVNGVDTRTGEKYTTPAQQQKQEKQAQQQEAEARRQQEKARLTEQEQQRRQEEIDQKQNVQHQQFQNYLNQGSNYETNGSLTQARNQYSQALIVAPTESEKAQARARIMSIDQAIAQKEETARQKRVTQQNTANNTATQMLQNSQADATGAFIMIVLAPITLLFTGLEENGPRNQYIKPSFRFSGLRWSNKSGHGKCLTSQSRERTKKHQIGFPTEV